MAGYDWTIGKMDNVQPWQLFLVCADADADAGGCNCESWQDTAESGEKKKYIRSNVGYQIFRVAQARPGYSQATKGLRHQGH